MRWRTYGASARRTRLRRAKPAIADIVLTAGYGYLPLFIFAGSFYLLAYGWMVLLLPRIERVEGAGGPAPLPQP